MGNLIQFILIIVISSEYYSWISKKQKVHESINEIKASFQIDCQYRNFPRTGNNSNVTLFTFITHLIIVIIMLFRIRIEKYSR